MTEPVSRKKIGLALGGGFIRATAHIGVLEVLQENGIPIDMVAGCSAGAAVAGAFCSGTLEQFKRRLIVGPAREYWRIIFEPTFPKRGLLKGERNREWFGEFVGDKTFVDMDPALILVATDFRSMREVVLDSGSVKHAIQACTAVPGIFVPVEKDGMTLADGGNFNLLPTRQLYARGMDYVITVDTSQPPNRITRSVSWLKQLLNVQPVYKSGPAFENPDREMHIFELMRRAFQLSSSQIKNLHHSSYPYDMLIRPDVVGVRRWHVTKAQYLVEQGRQATEAALPQIKRALGL